MYQKFDSMYGRRLTGSYGIKQDPYQGFIISGSYDNGVGDRSNSYLVSDLMPTGTMTWTVINNENDVCRYERCTELPAEVVKESKDITGTEE